MPAASQHTHIGAKRAREARAAFGLAEGEPVPCVLTLAEEQAGLAVAVVRLPEQVAGALAFGWLVWVNGEHGAARRRFTVAHELGHVRCEHPGRPRVDTVEALFGNDPFEVQANAFAAELLAPAAGVRELVDGTPTLEDAVAVAERFGVSCLAATFRFERLGLASREHLVRLRAECEEGLLAPAPYPDAMAQVQPPRWPERLRGSALEAVAGGRSSVRDAAAAAAVDPAHVHAALPWL